MPARIPTLGAPVLSIKSLLPVLALGVSLSTCQSATALPDRDVEVALVKDTALAYIDANTIELGIQVVLRNHDTRDVFLNRCGHVLQRLTTVGWQTTVNVPCNHPGNALVVSPNTGGLVGIGLRARRDTLRGRWPESDVAGEYRVIVAAMGTLTQGGGGVPLPTVTRTSPTFPVVIRLVTSP